MPAKDQFSISRNLEVGGKSYRYFSLQALEEQGYGSVSKLPFSIRVFAGSVCVSSTDVQLPKIM